jgi:hypothetical protein
MANTMGVNFQGVQATASDFASQAGEAAQYAKDQIATGLGYAWEGTCNFGNKVFTTASPYVQSLSGKAQQTWTAFLPHAAKAKDASVAFIQSPLGKSFTLLFAAIVVLKVSELIQDNRYISVAFTILGVVCAMTAGMYLYGSGVLPSSFNPFV